MCERERDRGTVYNACVCVLVSIRACGSVADIAIVYRYAHNILVKFIVPMHTPPGHSSLMQLRARTSRSGRWN